MPALATRPTSPVEPVHPVIPTPTSRDAHRRPDPAPVERTVYFSIDGMLHHARCGSPLQFRRVRAQIEADFWCITCLEHVALSRYALSEVPHERGMEPTNVVQLPR